MELRAYEYHLPFKTSYQWGAHQLDERSGFILTLQNKSDSTPMAIGEVAPLYGHSAESIEQIRHQIKTKHSQLQKELSGTGPLSSMRDSPPFVDLYPSLQYGIDMLCCIRHSVNENRALPKTLFDDHLNSIPVNATIGLGEMDETLNKINNFIQQGYETFKIKVGKDFRKEEKLLSTIRDRFPNVSLRIDVNEQWNYPEALEKLNKLKHLRIEYCEQPLPRNNWRGMSKLTRTSPIPIAADESITDIDAFYRAINKNIASYYVIKSMLVGSIIKLVEACRYARQKNSVIIFSSLLESGWGRLMNAALASGLDTGNRAHGLATGTLFSHDLLDQAQFMDGNQFILPPDGKSIGNFMRNIDFEILTAVI